MVSRRMIWYIIEKLKVITSICRILQAVLYQTKNQLCNYLNLTFTHDEILIITWSQNLVFAYYWSGLNLNDWITNDIFSDWLINCIIESYCILLSYAVIHACMHLLLKVLTLQMYLVWFLLMKVLSVDGAVDHTQRFFVLTVKTNAIVSFLDL